MKMNIVNPANGAMIAAVQQDDQTSLDSKYSTLKEGQKQWSAVPLQKRIETIQAYSKLLAAHIETLAKTLTDEVGKPLQQSRNEINGSISRIEWLTNNAEKYLAEEIMSASAGASASKHTHTYTYIHTHIHSRFQYEYRPKTSPHIHTYIHTH
jgi:acyl-CoA reductase-like NAD-dependent aldehyde dehydrogenase